MLSQSSIIPGLREGGPWKIAHVRVLVDNDKMELVVEAGFSEKCEDLLKDVRLLLEGTTTVYVVVLVQLREVLGYIRPTRGLGLDALEFLLYLVWKITSLDPVTPEDFMG